MAVVGVVVTQAHCALTGLEMNGCCEKKRTGDDAKAKEGDEGDANLCQPIARLAGHDPATWAAFSVCLGRVHQNASLSSDRLPASQLGLVQHRQLLSCTLMGLVSTSMEAACREERRASARGVYAGEEDLLRGRGYELWPVHIYSHSSVSSFSDQRYTLCPCGLQHVLRQHAVSWCTPNHSGVRTTTHESASMPCKQSTPFLPGSQNTHVSRPC